MSKRVVLTATGWLLALVAVGAVVWDVVSPDVAAGTPAAQAGFRVGTVIGIALRTILLGGGAFVLLRLAGSPSRATAERSDLARILAEHRPLLPAERPAEADRYESLGESDLLDVYAHLDRAAQPERFRALLWAIARRA